MRVKLVLAIILSIVLIGVASWTRFFNRPTPSSNIAVESVPQPVKYKQNQTSENLNLLLSTSTSPLSKTETLGRGLISDYINLAINGQATPDGLNQLASDYVENVTLLNVANRISSFEVKTTTSIKINLSLYAEEMKRIINNHQLAITTIYSAASENISEESIYELGVRVGGVCGSTASNLKRITIPTVVLEPHVQLINLYLECEGAMKALSKTKDDPAESFSGLINLSSVANSEKEILNRIEAILIKNGI